MPASDAHVHVGYFLRKGYDGPFYYSPRRMTNLMKRCGVTEFIFSSTDCFAGVSLEDIYAEAQEVQRLAGSGAHAFFWVSAHTLQTDPELKTLPSWYEGLKLHGGEFPWLENPAELRRILSIAHVRHLAVQIHTDEREQSVLRYLPYCQEVPDVHIDLAHCKSVPEVVHAAKAAPNIWFDTAFSSPGTIEALLAAGVPEEKILFGTDLPVQQRFYDNFSLTAYLRKRLSEVTSPKIRYTNMKSFLGS